jgi:hypothetical protein
MASTMQDNIISSGYDAVYAATPASPTLRRLWAEHVLGPDFPPEFGHISFVTLPSCGVWLKSFDKPGSDAR